MNSRKYIGMDVHQVSISIAVRDANGKLVMESVIETKAATILECIRGIRGNLWVACTWRRRRSGIAGTEPTDRGAPSS